MEAVIYVADEPVKPEQLKEIFPAESFDKIDVALQKTIEEFNSRPGGMWIRQVAGGYRMTTRPEHHELVREYLKSKPSARLSMASLETLAVIAYRQPVTLAEILAIRGKKSREDIPLLVDHFLKKYGEREGKQIQGITREALKVLVNYAFPGNVPELENVVERAVVFAERNVLAAADLPIVLKDASEDGPERAGAPLPDKVRRLEVREIRMALR